jgi:hypothetical protein
VWMLDARNGELGPTTTIRVFDPSGRLRWEQPRRGRGPGEFMSARGLTQLSDGRIALADAVERYRITLLRSDAALDTVWILPPAYAVASGAPAPLVADRFGGLAVQLEGGSSRFLRLGRDGRILDSVVVPGTLAPAADQRSALYAPRSVPVPYALAGSGRSRVMSRDGGFVIHDQTVPYRIVSLRPVVDTAGRRVREWRPGDPVLVIERSDARAVPLSPAHRASLADSVRESARLARLPRGSPVPSVPLTKRAVNVVTVAQDDRIWVQRHVPSEMCPAHGDVLRGWCEPRIEFDVLAPDGRWLSGLRLLERAPLLARTMLGDTLWAVRRVGDDVQLITKYVVRWDP